MPSRWPPAASIPPPTSAIASTRPSGHGDPPPPASSATWSGSTPTPTASTTPTHGDLPLPGVTVALHAADGRLMATTTTGGDGAYLFTELPRGHLRRPRQRRLRRAGRPASRRVASPAPGQDNTNRRQPYTVTLGLNPVTYLADFGYMPPRRPSAARSSTTAMPTAAPTPANPASPASPSTSIARGSRSPARPPTRPACTPSPRPPPPTPSPSPPPRGPPGGTLYRWTPTELPAPAAVAAGQAPDDHRLRPHHPVELHRDPAAQHARPAAPRRADQLHHPHHQHRRHLAHDPPAHRCLQPDLPELMARPVSSPPPTRPTMSMMACSTGPTSWPPAARPAGWSPRRTPSPPPTRQPGPRRQHRHHRLVHHPRRHHESHPAGAANRIRSVRRASIPTAPARSRP